jgi:1-acyl-sn-glycerol-3-phosphate acyltransferase
MTVAHTARPLTAEDLLDVVAGLVAELSGPGAARPHLDDSLDRDLGISSLERVELLIRVERTFGVRLPDTVMADAATPRDLLIAVRQAAPTTAQPLPIPRSPGGRTPIPTAAGSLVDALRWHADHSPDRVHVHLRNDDDTETPITYAALTTAATMLGTALQRLGIASGDRVALMLPTERAFFETFLAALLVGAVPVPLYPPIRAEDLVAYTHRQESILRNAGARVLVTFAEAERLAALMRGRVPALETVTTVNRLHLTPSSAGSRRPAPDDPALIQYTSGSTGAPKGVLLSHANVLANIRAIGDALDIGPDDAAVSWLPLYHDMGLIGLWLGALYFGVPIAIMSPLAFLARPSRWLRAVHAHRGTISAAPNFAYDLCARRIPDAELEGLDLRAWRVAINGSEAVNPDTVERFTHRFAAYGFAPEAMCPAYGLAESSVALTIGRRRRPPRVDRVTREPFQRARIAEAAPLDDPRALRFVSCGVPLAGHEVRIAGESGAPLGERAVGHIQFRGPSTMRGYFDNPEATRAAMHGGWMDSGDLGYLANGELFVTGRGKDLIIQGGRNLSAEGIEALACAVPGIRPNAVAAFGVPDARTGTERVVVVAESREQDANRRDALQRAVRDRVTSGTGTPPDVVVIAEPRTILKTSSGKIRRSATREAYLQGTLGRRRSRVRQAIGLFAGASGAWAGRLAGWLGRAMFTAWIALVLAASLPVLWAYVALRRPGPHADRAARLWSHLALTACGLRPRVAGLEHLGTPGPVVMVANHSSYIDGVVLMAALPTPFSFVAKRGLLGYPLVGMVLRKAGHLTIDKAALSDRLTGADEVAKRLRAGGRLMLFPEGTFARRPGLLPFRLGAFRAAVDTSRPVIPVALSGTRDVLPDGTWLFRRASVGVTVGAPLVPHNQGWPEMVRLRDEARAFIARECGEAASTPD